MPANWQIINGVKYPMNDGMHFQKNIWRDTSNEKYSPSPVFSYGGKEWIECGELSFEEAKKYIVPPTKIVDLQSRNDIYSSGRYWIGEIPKRKIGLFKLVRSFLKI